MIYKISITAILFLTTSCLTKSTEKNELNYKENKTSFFDLAHGDWTKNQWIRKPENLKMLHATFKKFGYVDLIPSGLDSSSEFFLRDIYIKRNFYQLFDSLELTYTLDTIEDRYYREFWQRRKMEKNSTIVFEIVRDINNSRHTKLVYRPDLVNDTLFNLLEIQFEKDTLTSGQALINFETLKNMVSINRRIIYFLKESNILKLIGIKIVLLQLLIHHLSLKKLGFKTIQNKYALQQWRAFIGFYVNYQARSRSGTSGD
jgi:hypothetical protein